MGPDSSLARLESIRGHNLSGCHVYYPYGFIHFLKDDSLDLRARPDHLSLVVDYFDSWQFGDLT